MQRVDQIQADVKAAMKAQDKKRLATLRLITAAIKQVEVDERIVVDDQRLLSILDKLSKQRRESIACYQAAARPDLAEQENFELDIIKEYLPAPLSAEEINALISEAIAALGASSPADLGKVMTYLKPKLQGRVDMRQISTLIKERLS